MKKPEAGTVENCILGGMARHAFALPILLFGKVALDVTELRNEAAVDPGLRARR